MKIQLINAGSEGYDWKGSIPESTPLGILSIATYLKQQRITDEIEILDSYFLNAKSLLKRIDGDIVGISVGILTYPQAIEIAKQAKKNNALVVVGGPYTKFSGENIIRNRRDLIDIVVVGDGEVPFSKIVRGESLQNIENLIYMEKDELQKTEFIQFNRESFSIPDRKLINLNPYFEAFKKSYPLEPFIKPSNMDSHHGCEWFSKGKRCVFCALPDLETRLTSTKRTWEEIAYLRDGFGVDYINLHADDFLLNKGWFEEFYKNRINNIPALKTLARADRINKDTARKLKELNFHQIFIGMESGDDEILANTSKGETTKIYERAVNLLRVHDLKIRSTFILGLPGETEESALKTLKFIEKLLSYGNIELIGAGMLFPLPGSRSYSMMMDIPQLRKKYYGKDLFSLEEIKKDWVNSFCNVSYNFLEKTLEKILALAPSHGFASTRGFGWDIK